jgi:D-alanine-D-alanine ligase
MKKLQLGLIFGGRSCEHEVSVISALQLAHSVDRAKYDLHPIYINKSGEWFSGPGLLSLDTYKEPVMYTQKGQYERVTLDVTAAPGSPSLPIWTA